MAEPELRFSESRSAEIVAESFRACTDDRLRELMVTIVRHLHGFAKEVDLRQGELDAAIDFLTRTGRMCDDTRQEFVLLSDVLGSVRLVADVNPHRLGEINNVEVRNIRD